MDTSEECQKKEYPEEFGNGVYLGEEEGVDPKIPGCRKINSIFTKTYMEQYIYLYQYSS